VSDPTATAVEDEVLARVAAQEASQPTTQGQLYENMAEIYYLLKDDVLDAEFFLKNPAMRDLLPALSHLLRTSNVQDKNVIDEMKLRWKRACMIQVMVMQPSSLANQALLDAMLNFGYAAIEDLRDGWRGRLVTEKIKVFKMERPNAPRKKFLGLF
jgi:hypothetical protein